MKKYFKDFLVLLYKTIIISLIIGVFFRILSINNTALNTRSRTLAITLSTFVFSLIVMSKIYGFLEIGKVKSKQVIFNTTLNIFFTDLFTYLQLLIMNTNSANRQGRPLFKVEGLEYLLLAFVIQVLIIYVSAYAGNKLYFRLFTPMKTLIVFDDSYNNSKIVRTIERYKLQYLIIGVVRYDDLSLEQMMKKSDYVVLVGLDQNNRNLLLEKCYYLEKNITIENNLVDSIITFGDKDVIDDIPVINIRSLKLSSAQLFCKRVFDLIFSFIVLIVTLPIMFVCAILIKIEDGGQIFFRQERITFNGKVFLVIKFRTMHENVENFSSTGKNDNRITKVGRILRKSRLDELPQFINIIKGDMSFVGPRPEMVENVLKYEKEIPEFKYRLRVKGGLTGLAQIEGKYNTDPLDKLIMDINYIENYSFWEDIRLIFRTFTIFGKSDSTEGFKNGDD